MQLHLYCFPYELVHASGFAGQDIGFKEDPTDKFNVFHTCRFIWIVLSYGMMVFIDPDLDFVRSLSSMSFTFMVDAVCMV